MPIATYNHYQCPKCGYEKTLLQGDVLTSLPICPKCKEMMELVGDTPTKGVREFFVRWFGI